MGRRNHRIQTLSFYISSALLMSSLLLLSVIAIASTMIIITTTTTTTHAQEPQGKGVAIFDANNTVTIDGQNEEVWTGRDTIAWLFSGLLFGTDKVTHFELFENGSAVATITGNHSGIKVYYNHSYTPEFGYQFADNGTVFTPEGKELKVVFSE
jgi:hypothetical protein